MLCSTNKRANSIPFKSLFLMESHSHLPVASQLRGEPLGGVATRGRECALLNKQTYQLHSFQKSVLDGITFPASCCYATQRRASELSFCQGWPRGLPLGGVAARGRECALFNKQTCQLHSFQKSVIDEITFPASCCFATQRRASELSFY